MQCRGNVESNAPRRSFSGSMEEPRARPLPGRGRDRGPMGLGLRASTGDEVITRAVEEW